MLLLLLATLLVVLFRLPSSDHLRFDCMKYFSICSNTRFSLPQLFEPWNPSSSVIQCNVNGWRWNRSRKDRALTRASWRSTDHFYQSLVKYYFIHSLGFQIGMLWFLSIYMYLSNANKDEQPWFLFQFWFPTMQDLECHYFMFDAALRWWFFNLSWRVVLAPPSQYCLHQAQSWRQHVMVMIKCREIYLESG